MADAKRPTPPAGRPLNAPPVDPRVALAQQYLSKATTHIAEKEAEHPRKRRAAVAPDRTTSSAFSLSIAPATFIHVLLGAFTLTFAALAALWCFHLMMLNFVAGRVVALPTGVVVAATLGYLSVCFLGIIESTSSGHTNVDALQGDWQEWFWTLPATLGMLAVAAFIGWLFSLVLPINVWILIALSALLLYPILQLSSLETGSPLAPLSLPVVQSLVKHPLGWFVLYAVSFALANILWMIARMAWRDPPYLTVLIVGPLAAASLFFYAWLLGQLAHLISTEKEMS